MAFALADLEDLAHEPDFMKQSERTRVKQLPSQKTYKDIQKKYQETVSYPGLSSQNINSWRLNIPSSGIDSVVAPSLRCHGPK
jgi:hypothetical protein